MINNDRGFSLVQVLISSGMLGAAALVGIKMMANQERMAKSTNQKYEISYIHEEIWRTLVDINSCEATLKGHSLQDIEDGSIKKIRKSFNYDNEARTQNLFTTYSTSNTFYGVDNLKIHKYGIDLREDSSEPLFDLEVVFDKGENSIGSRFSTIKIPIVYSTQNNKIENCNALPLGSSDNDSSVIQTSRVELSNNVGINTPPTKNVTLKLQGELNLNPTTETIDCNEQSEGMIRFDSISENIQLCTGKGSWKNFGKDIIDWTRYTRVEISPSKEEIRPLGEYKFCALGEIQGINHTHCQLVTNQPDLVNLLTWKLKPSIKDSGSCTFLCFQ